MNGRRSLAKLAAGTSTPRPPSQPNAREAALLVLCQSVRKLEEQFEVVNRAVARVSELARDTPDVPTTLATKRDSNTTGACYDSEGDEDPMHVIPCNVLCWRADTP